MTKNRPDIRDADHAFVTEVTMWLTSQVAEV